jgi:flagellar hook-associated protein 3 FlgL
MAMRVTTRMMSELGVSRMNERLAQLERSQRSLATGRRIHVSSDDVSGMSAALSARAGIAESKQAQRNAADGLSWIQVAETRLSGATDQLQRANQLILEANNSTTGQTGLDAIGSELTAIRDSLLSVANSRHQGRFVFGGYSSATPVEDPGSGWAYAGDNGEVRRRVGEGDSVVVNVTADDVFGFTAGDDIFTTLDGVISDLAAGDRSNLGAAIDSVQGALDRVLDGRGVLGAAANRIELAEFRARADELDLKTQLSSVEDTDMAEAIMELQIQEVSYQAAQSALAKSLQPSLAQFLR